MHNLSGKSRRGKTSRIGSSLLINLVRKAVKIKSYVIDYLVFPSFCRICGHFLSLPKEKIVCQACLSKIKPCYESSCLCCGRFFSGVSAPHLCSRCLSDRPCFSQHLSCGKYEGELRDLILLLKYGRIAYASQFLGEYACRSLETKPEIFEEVDYLVPVPLHRTKTRQRGFNQAALIARYIARKKQLSILENCLIKTKNTRSQAELDAKEREKNQAGAYRVKAERSIRGKVILLVDDVFTTGATVKECSLVLISAGAKEVRVLTIAQA